MIKRREFLEKCHRLSYHGWLKNFQPGSIVARGFADVGFEEFYILHDFRIVSLLSGITKDFEESDRQHFFIVPEISEITKECELKDIKIISLELEKDRNWKVVLEGRTCPTVVSCSSTPEDALLDTLLEIFSGKKAAPQLITSCP